MTLSCVACASMVFDEFGPRCQDQSRRLQELSAVKSDFADNLRNKIRGFMKTFRNSKKVKWVGVRGKSMTASGQRQCMEDLKLLIRTLQRKPTQGPSESYIVETEEEALAVQDGILRVRCTVTNDVAMKFIDCADLSLLCADEYYGTNNSIIEAKNVGFQTKTKQYRHLCTIFCLGATAELYADSIMGLVKFGLTLKLLTPKDNGKSKMFDGVRS